LTPFVLLEAYRPVMLMIRSGGIWLNIEGPDVTRKKILLLTAILIATAAAGAITSCHRRHLARVQELNHAFARIEIGMNQADAEAIIGRPPDYVGDYGVTENRVDECWCIEGNRLDLQLTRNPRVVVKKDLSPLYHPGLLDWLRRLVYGY
jgi:hypothetical protein